MECRLTDDWENTENIIIYGFGKVAHDNLDFFKNNFNIVYIVDGFLHLLGDVSKNIAMVI